MRSGILIDMMLRDMRDAERDFKKPSGWRMSFDTFRELRRQAYSWGTVEIRPPNEGPPKFMGWPIEIDDSLDGWKLDAR